MPRDWGYKLFSNIVRCFRGINLLWHILAVTLTYFLVTSGFDWWYFASTRAPLFATFGFPAAVLGFLIPVALPISLYIYARVRTSVVLKNASSAMGQAAIIGWLVAAFYKTFTGRPHPEFLAQLSHVDISRVFHFGFYQGGIFYGWPSSHTTVAFAMAAALAALYPMRKRVMIPALIYALYIGLGVSVTIHWFSDFTAGAIIGTVVGLVVGKSYRKRLI